MTNTFRVMTKATKNCAAQETGIIAYLEKDSIRYENVPSWSKGTRITTELAFKIGDEAVWGGFNFAFFGVIEKITEKTVTIRPVCGRDERKVRIDHARFADLNKYGMDYYCKQRNEWYD